MRARAVLSLTGIAVLAIALPALAAGSESSKAPAKPEPTTTKSKEKSKEKSGEVVVITNDELEARYGRSPAATSAAGGATPSPITPATPGKGEAPKAAPTAAPTVKEVAARRESLGKEIARLERRVASLRNPFLPKEPATDEERAAEQGLGAAERVARLEGRIRELRAELADLP